MPREHHLVRTNLVLLLGHTLQQHHHRDAQFSCQGLSAQGNLQALSIKRAPRPRADPVCEGTETFAMLCPSGVLLLPLLVAPIVSVRYVRVLKNTIHPAESQEVGDLRTAYVF